MQALLKAGGRACSGGHSTHTAGSPGCPCPFRKASACMGPALTAQGAKSAQHSPADILLLFLYLKVKKTR